MTGLEIAGGAVAAVGLGFTVAGAVESARGQSGSFTFTGFDEYSATMPTLEVQVDDEIRKLSYKKLNSYEQTCMFTRRWFLQNAPIIKIQCSFKLAYETGYYYWLDDQGQQHDLNDSDGNLAYCVRNVKILQNTAAKGGRVVYNKLNEPGYLALKLTVDRTDDTKFPDYVIEWNCDLKGRSFYSHHHGVHGGSWVLDNVGSIGVKSDPGGRTSRWFQGVTTY
jgi:hypothetical protein